MPALTFQAIPDGVAHYRDRGPANAPALVFANSLGTDLRVWEPVADHFAGRFRVLQMDKRGHGLSTGPAGAATIEALADDLAAVMDARGVANALVLGVSVGGMIAQALAARRPTLVKAMVLSNTGHKIGAPDAWDARIEAVRQGGLEAIADAVMERWFAESFASRDPAALAGWRAMLCRTTADGYNAVCGAIRDADLTETVRGLAQPALCLAGAQDGAAPPDLVRALADLMADARYVEIAGVGHLPSVEAPDKVIEAVETFIAEIGFQ